MKATDLLIETYGRLPALVHAATTDLREEQLTYRPVPQTNSIAWLVWHSSRVIDAQIAALGGGEQAWHSGWSKKFNLPFDESATGYGQTSQEVEAVKASSELLLGYFDAVLEQAMAYVGTLDDHSLDDIIDTNWDPPVTRGVRLVSIVSDVLQHAGQAAYIRGCIETK